MAIAAQVAVPFIGCNSLPVRDAADEWGLKPLLYDRGDARTAAELIERATTGATILGRLANKPDGAADFVKNLVELARDVAA